MDMFQLIERLAAGGFATFLVAILIAGKYEVWIWGHQHQERIKRDAELLAHERAEKEYWRNFAMSGREMTDRSISAVAKLAGQS